MPDGNVRNAFGLRVSLATRPVDEVEAASWRPELVGFANPPTPEPFDFRGVPASRIVPAGLDKLSKLHHHVPKRDDVVLGLRCSWRQL